MAVLLVGTFAGIDEEKVTPASGEPFVSRTAKVRDDSGRTEYARLSRDFTGPLPEVGEAVTLRVWPRPYVKKASDSLGCSWTAYAVARELSHV